MANQERPADWAKQIARREGKFLTLGEVATMATRGEVDGWYVAPCKSKWTIGRRSGAEHYPIMVSARTITFDTMANAARYLRALLVPTAVAGPWVGRLHLKPEIASTA